MQSTFQKTNNKNFIQKYIENSSTPSSFFNDPKVLWNYIDKQLQDADSNNNLDPQKSRRAVSNQESYRKTMNAKKLKETPSAKKYQPCGMTQSSFFNKNNN